MNCFMTTKLPFARGLVLAFLALVVPVLAGCDGLAAMAGPTDRFVVQPASGAVAAELAADIEASRAIIRKRLEAFGLTVHKVEPTPDGQLVIEVSGSRADEAFAAAFGIKGDLAIRLVDIDAPAYELDQGIVPPGSELLDMADGSGPVAVKRIGGISGDRVVQARTGIDEFTDQPMVMIAFDEAGTRKFAQMTAANVGKPLAIVLDGKVLSAPVINEPIVGGNAQIAGGYTQESANQMAAAISSGALPVAFTLVEHKPL
jgi:preprotein translocase subunit SecD